MEIKFSKHSLKKYMSIILAVVLLFSCFGQMVLASATFEKPVKTYAALADYEDEEIEYTEVFVDTDYSVDSMTSIKFAVPKDGFYVIQSYGDDDPYLMFQNNSYDDYNGSNFRCVFYGYEGDTYYGTVRQYDSGSTDKINFDIVYCGEENPNEEDHYVTGGDFYVASGDFEGIVNNRGECIVTWYGGNEQEVTVPETIDGYTVVGFDDDICWQLRNSKILNLPAGIRNLDLEYLSDIASLEKINIAEGSEYFTSVDGVLFNNDITELLFYPRARAGSMTVPASVHSIRVGAFAGVDCITDIVIEQGNTSFVCSDGVLYNSDITRAIKEFAATGIYTMPSTVEVIDPYAFSNADEIKKAIISSKVTEVSYSSFAGCDDLEDVNILDGVESISRGAFFECKKMNTVSIAKTVTYIGDRAFMSSGLTSVDLPDSLECVGDSVFAMSESLADVKLGSGIQYVGTCMFRDCIALEDIEYPSNIQYIAYSAFENTGLKNVVIPDNIEYIESLAYSECKALETVYIGEGVLGMSSAFIGCPALKGAYIGSNVEYMESAFSDCSNLETVEFADGFKGSMKYAFIDCEKLNTVDLPSTVVEISYSAFKGCSDLDGFELPEGLESVAAHSFDKTKWLNSQADGDVYLDNVLYCYKDSDAENADSNSEWCYHDEVPENYTLDVKEGTKIIADCAYGGQENLEYVILPQELQYIGQSAFYNSGIKEIFIKNSVVRITYNAFYDCDELTDVYYSGSREEWESIRIDYGNDDLLNAKIHFNYYVCQHQNTTDVPAESPTCDKHGYTFGVYCHDCETWIEGHKFLLATGLHIYSEVVTSASCERGGYTTYNCVNCGYSYIDDHVSALGHADNNKDGYCDRCALDMTNGCECQCHSTGIEQIIYKIVRFFWKLFKINPVCECGVKHY